MYKGLKGNTVWMVWVAVRWIIWCALIFMSGRSAPTSEIRTPGVGLAVIMF